MPVDYSKWDALELSDDSDIEVHPNVDKYSFIRAKQNQIHQQRYERKNKIETYKYERIINDGLAKRINSLFIALQSHSRDGGAPESIFMQSFMETIKESRDEAPPPRPAGIHTEEKDPPPYSKMLAILVDQVQADIKKDNKEDDIEAYVSEVKFHLDKVTNLQKQLLEELHKLEVEEGKKITSESIHTGFDSSYIAHSEHKPESKKKTAIKKEKVESVEVLNPHVLAAQEQDQDAQQSSGADADIDEPEPSDEDDIADVQCSELGKLFASVRFGDYRACLQFISEHPQVVTEKETDGLLVMAFNACLEGLDDFGRQCVHQGLLLQYCRALGRDGVQIFFKRITTPGHQAQKVFFDDVNSTFARIKSKAKEITSQREKEQADGPVEQIQLHAVDPETAINIQVPPEKSDDPATTKAREMFNSFPPGLQRALESGSLDEVNKVLGKMSLEDAEEVVGQLGEGGMLSLEEQIIDATTEEGKKALKEFENQERAAAKERESQVAESSANPGHTSDPE